MIDNQPIDQMRRKPGGGFTLLELLVVMAVIGILAALVLPSLSRARNKTARVVDLNNLKQQTMVMQAYSNDNRQILPRPNWDDGGGPGVLGLPGWLYTPDPTGAASARFQVQSGLFWPALHDPKLYVCPLDNPSAPLFKQRPQQISSYALNGAIVGYRRNIDVPVSMARMSPDDVAFWETDEQHPRYFNDGSNFPSEGVSRRHSEGGIAAAFDGSVSFVKYQTWYREEADLMNRNRLWCYPESENGR